MDNWESEWIEFPLDQGAIVFVDVNAINLDDLRNVRPGSIIRCDRSPAECMKWIPPQLLFEHYGFIAGMISDAA